MLKLGTLVEVMVTSDYAQDLLHKRGKIVRYEKEEDTGYMRAYLKFPVIEGNADKNAVKGGEDRWEYVFNLKVV